MPQVIPSSGPSTPEQVPGTSGTSKSDNSNAGLVDDLVKGAKTFVKSFGKSSDPKEKEDKGGARSHDTIDDSNKKASDGTSTDNANPVMTKQLEVTVPGTAGKASQPIGGINAATSTKIWDDFVTDPNNISKINTQYSSYIKEAAANLSNPKLSPADQDKISTAMLNLSTEKGQSDFKYNGFLSDNYAIALVSAMMDFEKSQEVGVKVAATLTILNRLATIDAVDAEAQNILSSALIDAVKDLVQAACSAGMMCCQLGGGIKGMGAKTMNEQQTAQLLSQAGASLFTALQNAASAPLDLEKGKLEAAKVLMDAIVKILQDESQTLDQMYSNYQQNFGSFNDALNQLLQQISQIIKSLTDKGS